MRKSIAVPAVTIALAALLSTTAHATLVLDSLIDGVGFTCSDNAACDTNPTLGVLAVGAQTFGSVTISGSIQQTFVGGTNTINTSSLTVQNNGTATSAIRVVVGATGFTGPNNQFDASGSATFNADIGGTLHVEYYDDPANGQLPPSLTAPTPSGTEVAFADKTVLVNSDSFAFDTTGTVNDPSLFSMGLVASGNLIAGGEIVSRGQTLTKTEAVPEPGSLVMFGTALLGLGALGWLRRRKDDHTGLSAA